MEDKEMKAIIESLLFTWGDPLNIKDISNITEISTRKVENLIEEMISDFDYNRRGLRIVKMEDSYQIGTRPEHYKWIKKLHKQKPPKVLSNAALETLSIIAYKQPVIKSQIEFIRGVKCDTALTTLLNRDLIEEKGRLDRTGRPIVYGTTEEFLRLFSLESIEDLPELEKVRKDLVEEEIDDKNLLDEIQE